MKKTFKAWTISDVVDDERKLFNVRGTLTIGEYKSRRICRER